MRAFLAIEVSDEARKELLKIQKQLPEFKGNSVSKENLHLTLKFFGEISEKDLLNINDSLQKLSFERFEGSLGITGIFNNEKFIRVVWVSVEPSEKVKKLNKEINKILNSKDEQFESHITLARIKFIKDKNEFIKKLKEIKIKPIKFQIEKIVLKKSLLTQKGRIYETVKEFKLQ